MPTKRQPHPSHLPAPLTALIGRETDLAIGISMLMDRRVRLITLTGPPGAGKTRLALAAAERVGASFPDGLWFVPLASLEQADFVLPTIARTLDVRQLGRRPVLEALIEALREQQLLLVLDNFEHVLPSAPAIVDLLHACPGLKILTTSRARLRISGEHLLPVPPLELPPLEPLPTVDELAEVPAVQLFVERTRAVQPEFQLSSANARPVAELCVRLDGLPLAIELAAARCGVFDPLQLITRLEDRFTILSDGPPDLPPRQRTLGAALAWSYDLLTETEQHAFRALGVFAGGCTLDAVRAVSGGQADVLSAVEALVDRSLLRRVNEPGNPLRFDMLQTVNDYARERLVASGELHATQQRHAGFFMEFAERAANPQLDDADGPRLMEAIERDHDNFRAALRWLIDGGRSEDSLCLAGALWSFWEKRGYWTEGIGWLESALSLGDGARSAARARALLGVAVLHRERSEYAEAARFARESIAIQREIGYRLHGSRIMFGDTIALAGDPSTGTAVVMEPSALRQAEGLPRAWAHLVAGHIAAYQADFRTAREHYETAMKLRDGQDGNELDANLKHALGTLRAGVGDASIARPMLEDALTQFRKRKEMRGVARVLLSLGALFARHGDPALARATLNESLSVFRRLGEAVGVALSSLLLGLPLPEAMLADLGPDALPMWWRVNLGIDAPPLTNLVDWCVVPNPTVTPSRLKSQRNGLTRREREILALIALHHSNRQIADELVLSIRTVERHISNIYTKTGSSRRRLAETYGDYVFT